MVVIVRPWSESESEWERQQMSEGGGERLRHPISIQAAGRAHSNGGGALSFMHGDHGSITSSKWQAPECPTLGPKFGIFG